MAYVKNTWNTGDTITADLMNHIENGIYDNAEAVISQSGEIEEVQTALATKESVANKVTEITDESTDAQYPSAKAVYDAIGGAGGSGITTYHMTVNAVQGSEGYVESGTIQTDIPDVSDWTTFETICRNLAESANELYFRVNVTSESGAWVPHPTYQFMGLINSPNNPAVSVGIYGDKCCFEMGNDDGIYRHIVLREGTDNYSIGLDSFTFVS